MIRLSSGIALILVVTSSPARAELFRRGDVNLDTRLDISDGVAVLLALFVEGAAPPACEDGADANDDGRVNVSDAVFLLEFIFLGGAPPPPPGFGSDCAGPDPTPDELGCDAGEGGSTRPPTLELSAVRANAPGVRQRSRFELDSDSDGAFRVESGHSFGMLLVVSSNLDSRARFDLAGSEGADPEALIVTCDRDLGDPARGGVDAGGNLARFFLNELDGWENRIYLLEHVAMRVGGEGPLAPAAGIYRFAARVRDERCAWSDAVEMTLIVEPPASPEIVVQLERDGEVVQHDAGTGNARGDRGALDGVALVVDALANPRGGGAPDASSLRATLSPPVVGFDDVADLFTTLPDGRLSLALDGELPLPPGDTDVTLGIETEDGGATRSVTFRIELALSHALDIQPIWTESCTGCHEEPNPFKGLVLVDPSPDAVHRNIVNVFAAEPAITSTAPLLVWPYHPERSYLFHKIRGSFLDPDVAGEGVRMPADGGELPEATVHLIQSWISQGAAR